MGKLKELMIEEIEAGMTLTEFKFYMEDLYETFEQFKTDSEKKKKDDA